jgi:hypothetical protein
VSVAVREEVGFAPTARQVRLLRCPVEDVLFGGARGGGKTVGLLADWLYYQHRYGQHARGILVRRTYPELEEVEQLASELYPRAGAVWRAQARTWHFPQGPTLKLRFLQRDDDADRYQGHSYTWVGVDEVGNFPSSLPIDKMRATLRSPHGLPCRMRQTANPGGPGHAWLKRRYVEPVAPGTPHVAEIQLPDGSTAEVERVFIPSTVDDNPYLGPDYWERIAVAAAGQEWLLKAWRWGEWEIAAGAFFADVWLSERHVLKPFGIPPTWTKFRSFDWGSESPACLQHWAESDGSPAPTGRVFPRGSLFLTDEWYVADATQSNRGLRLSNEQLGAGIAERGRGHRWAYGVADTQIFAEMGRPSIYVDMLAGAAAWAQQHGHKRHGVVFGPADKERIAGWQRVRTFLRNALADPPERPCLWAFQHCRAFIEQAGSVPRSSRHPEDVDTDSEDHCFVGATLVATDRGPVRIDRLIDGDRVLTLDGYRSCRNPRRTRQAAPTVKVVLEGGHVETCTADHEWLTTTGWCRADQLDGAELPDWTMSTESAPPAVDGSPSTATRRRRPALGRAQVLYVGRAEPADVYCLTIPIVEHFCLASGAVVHNCMDAARYAVMSTRPRGPRGKRADREKGPTLDESIVAKLGRVEDADW